MATGKKRGKKKAPSTKLPPEGLSMRAYALHRLELGLSGGSHPAVGKAIRDGRLTSRSAKKVGNRWMIDPEKADKEWEDATHALKTRDPKRISAARKATADRKRAAAAESLDDDLLEQRSLFGADHNPRPKNQATELVSEGDRASTAKVTRAGAFYSAQLKRLEYLERSGRLVEANAVDAETFAAFRAVRDLILGIPDREGAILAAETDPATVRNMLREALREAFEALANDLRRK